MSRPRPAAARTRAFRRDLTEWFARNRRDLPWRRDRTPYRVWISEAMLQQTRVDTVIPYFLRFLEQFPSVQALADATEQAVLKAWEGLGYYSRARNLRRAAQVMVKDHGGHPPRTHGEWLALPGVGPYTAAAVASLALDLDHAVLDGNVIRVLARTHGYAGEVSRPAHRDDLQALADDLLPKGRASIFNEAMMELGALVCLPRAPRCPECPLARVCTARNQGTPEAFPVKKRKPPVPLVRVGAAATRDARGRFLIARRLDKGLLAGLWEFPGGKIEAGESVEDCVRRELREELNVEVAVGPELLTVRHAYTHFKLEMHVHLARKTGGRPRAIECADFRWATLADMRALPFSKADLMVIDWLEKNQPS